MLPKRHYSACSDWRCLWHVSMHVHTHRRVHWDTKSSDPPITIPGHVCVCVCVCVLPFYPIGDPTLSATPTPTLSHIWQRCTFACFDTLFLYLHCKRVRFHRSVSCLHRLRGVCVYAQALHVSHKQTASRSYCTRHFAVELGMAGGCYKCNTHTLHLKRCPLHHAGPIMSLPCLTMPYMHVDPCHGLLRWGLSCRLLKSCVDSMQCKWTPLQTMFNAVLVSGGLWRQ